MFYETEKNNHGLPHNPFKSCVVPRPIGWITSLTETGVPNLAPFSFFNAVSDIPPMVMYAISNKHEGVRLKDSLVNVEKTKEFVVNIATWDLKEQVNQSSGDYAAQVNEIEITGLETEPSTLVKPPRIKASPIHLECEYYESVQLPVQDDRHSNRIVIGKVVGVHIKDEYLVDGKVDVTLFKPIARLGYMEYAVIEKVFTMPRP